MTEFFTSVTAGFSRFVLAWLIPAGTTLGLFCLFVYPVVRDSLLFAPIDSVVSSSRIEAVAVFTFASVLLAMVVALASLPMYRMLEGYRLPPPLKRRLMKRQVREWHRLTRLHSAIPEKLAERRDVIAEKLRHYPSDPSHIMPTRLGNAFRATESYGRDKFGLDTQTMWYELNSAVNSQLRKDLGDQRAAVDFFISFVGYLTLLGSVSVIVGLFQGALEALAVGFVSFGLARLAYNAAVNNMLDLGFAVQALVNVGRAPLATALGYDLPDKIVAEVRFWRSLTFAFRPAGRVRDLERYDHLRRIGGTGDMAHDAAS